MPDEYVDPSGNTEQFRAFLHAPETTAPAAATPSRLPLIIGAALAAVVLIALVLWLALG